MPFRHLVLSALACLAAAALTTPVHADCVDDCQASTYCDSTMYATGECNDKLLTCYQEQCNRPTISYGAIAYGAQSQAFGFAYDQSDANASEQVAMSNCKKHGDDCQIVTSFSNSCAAVAAGDGSSYAVGQGATRDLAQAAAMANCAKTAGGSCEVQVWSCALR
jgi:hypothetical protein